MSILNYERTSEVVRLLNEKSDLIIKLDHQEREYNKLKELHNAILSLYVEYLDNKKELDTTTCTQQ